MVHSQMGYFSDLSFPENVLKTALALYMYGDSVSLPLPTFEEVLVCNPATTTEEVSNTHCQTSFPDLIPKSE